ncbi:MAG TPA: adenine phosphoribosyltransferase [Polyangiales bacterium]|nr:adenine phosphoribosyltransferase [Polyangiales bacterium]
MSDAVRDVLKACIRDIPDFPKPGILFKDITPILSDPRAFNLCLDTLAETYDGVPLDVIVGIEARGFIFGAALASRMRKAFVPARKPGKLPSASQRVEYQLEYGTDAIEMHIDAISAGQRVLVVDDVLATGGTANATCELVRKLGGEVIGASFVIELTFLSGRDRLRPIAVSSLLQY